MIKWIRTSRLSIKNSLFLDLVAPLHHGAELSCEDLHGRPHGRASTKTDVLVQKQDTNTDALVQNQDTIIQNQDTITSSPRCTAELS